MVALGKLFCTRQLCVVPWLVPGCPHHQVSVCICGLRWGVRYGCCIMHEEIQLCKVARLMEWSVVMNRWWAQLWNYSQVISQDFFASWRYTLQSCLWLSHSDTLIVYWIVSIKLNFFNRICKRWFIFDWAWLDEPPLMTERNPMRTNDSSWLFLFVVRYLSVFLNYAICNEWQNCWNNLVHMGSVL